jgi:hypothetical protein
MRQAQTILQAHEGISKQLGEDTAHHITSFVDQKITMSLEHAAIKADLSEIKFDLLKWMFIFWVSQFIPTVGLIIALLYR